MQKAVTYISFPDLQDFPDDHLFKTNAKEFLETDMPARVAEPEEWHRQFEALDFLRMMNKYHTDVLVNNILNFAKFIKESIENLRSGISKNALMFTTEFFNNS